MTRGEHTLTQADWLLIQRLSDIAKQLEAIATVLRDTHDDIRDIRSAVEGGLSG